jgi:fructose-bisphosphate aldolase class I
MTDLENTAQALVAVGKGILAADETPHTLTKRFASLQIDSTPESRRAYRELLFTTPEIAGLLSGVILQDETMRQRGTTGVLFTAALSEQGILPGIKVDTGTKPLAGFPGETVTEGLDGLRDRLAEYRRLGARFAKWRAVIRITETLPSSTVVDSNAHALARYAALCQEQGLVPIVEPEVLMDGPHTLERCEAVTSSVLQAVFGALFAHRVALEGMLLKPNMIIPGESCPTPASVQEVAAATLRCLRRHVPAAVPGIVFLSGGQKDVFATRHLNAINRLGGAQPWALTFSYGRALQDAALRAWKGKDEHAGAAQDALHHRARLNAAAALGEYSDAMEGAKADQSTYAHSTG